MDVVSQFIVDLSWGLTFGALLAAGSLAAKAAGIVLIGAIGLGLGVFAWRKLLRARR